MRILSTLILIVISIIAHAQKDSAVTTNADTAKKFQTIQIEAQFPGGDKGWQRYLQASLNANLGAKYLKPKKGQTITQVAMVSFLVDTEGNITEVQIVNPKEVHPKLAAESIRAIKEGPKWIPATQNGKKVILPAKASNCLAGYSRMN